MGKRKNNRKLNKRKIEEKRSQNVNLVEKPCQDAHTKAVKNNETIPGCSLTQARSYDSTLIKSNENIKQKEHIEINASNISPTAISTKKENSILTCSSQMLENTEDKSMYSVTTTSFQQVKLKMYNQAHKENVPDKKITEKNIGQVVSIIDKQTVSNFKKKKSYKKKGTHVYESTTDYDDLEFIFGVKPKASNSALDSSRDFEDCSDDDSADLELMYGVKPKKINQPITNSSYKFQCGKPKIFETDQKETRSHNECLTVSRNFPKHVYSNEDIFAGNGFNDNSNWKGKIYKDDSKHHASYSQKPPGKNQNFDSNIQIFKQNMFRSVNSYKESKNVFSGVYRNWLQTREDTLQKLKTLILDLHNDQLYYNKAQVGYREFGMYSRIGKSSIESETFGFLASVTAFLSDAASGITSVAQAVNVDTYRTKFQEIIDHDAKITKSLYNARSQCLVKYNGVEEIMRKFSCSTFNSTAGEVSNALEVSKFWEAVKTAHKNDDMSKVMSLVGNFVDRGCQSEVLENVRKSVETYVSENPAALDACKSAGRAVCGVIDSLGVNKNKNSVGRNVMREVSNQLMIMQDRHEIEQLQCTIDEGLSQTKLEDQIQDVIDSLNFEMEEIRKSYFEYLGSGIYNDDHDAYDDDDNYNQYDSDDDYF